VQPTFSKAFLFSVMSSDIQRPSLFARSECSRAEHYSGFLFQSGTSPRFRVDGGHSPALGATPKLETLGTAVDFMPEFSRPLSQFSPKVSGTKCCAKPKQLRRDFKKPTFPSSSFLTQPQSRSAGNQLMQLRKWSEDDDLEGWCQKKSPADTRGAVEYKEVPVRR
jgi:hypothetical protein